jgi:hypothetical protein
MVQSVLHDPPMRSFHEHFRVIVFIGKERVKRQSHSGAFLRNFVAAYADYFFVEERGSFFKSGRCGIFALMVGERHANTKRQLFFGQCVAHLKHQGTVAFKAEGMGKHTAKSVYQRSVAVEVNGVTLLVLFTVNAHRAAFFVQRHIRRLAPLQRLIYCPHAFGAGSGVQNKLAQRQQLFAQCVRLGVKHGSHRGVSKRRSSDFHENFKSI